MSSSFLKLLEAVQQADGGGTAGKAGSPSPATSAVADDRPPFEPVALRPGAPPSSCPAEVNATNANPAFNPTVTIVSTRTALKAIVKAVTGSAIVVLDLETTGTDPVTDRIVGVGLAVGPDAGWYIPVGHTSPETPQLDLVQVLEALGQSFPADGGGRVLVAHNAVFDLGFLRQAGLDYRGPLFDTMVAAHLLRPDQPCGLKAVAGGLLGIRDWAIEVRNVEKRPVSELGAYCVRDAAATLRLYEALRDQVAEGYERIFDLEMRFIPVLMGLEASPYPVDLPRARQMRDEVIAEVDAIKANLTEYAGRAINWRSGNQVREFVHGQGPGKLGLPVLARTPSGRPSTRRDVLIALANQHTMMIKLARLKVLQARLSHYLDPMVEAGRDHVRCGYSQIVQITGRVSCTGTPNLGLVPKPEEDPPVGQLPDIQSLFIAGTGNVIVKVDYSGQELAILAALAGEEKMLEAIRRGEDLHGTVAVTVFNLRCEPGEVKAKFPAKRNVAKTIQFGIVYGMEAYGLAKRLGVLELEAEKIIRRYFRAYPAVQRYLERVKRDALRFGLVRDPSGRMRPLPALRDPRDTKAIWVAKQAALREAVNFPVQATGGVVLREAAISIHKFLVDEEPRARLLTIRHDEIQVLLPADQAPTLVPRLKALAEGVDLSAYGLDVPLRVEVQVGPRWATLQPWSPSSTASRPAQSDPAIPEEAGSPGRRRDARREAHRLGSRADTDDHDSAPRANQQGAQSGTTYS